MKLFLTTLLITLLFSPIFSQDSKLGILESGEFSTHKYFNEIYKDQFNLFEESEVIPAIPLNLRTSLNKYKVMGYMPYWFVNRWNTISYDLLYVIAYHSAEADSNGNITNNHGWLTDANVTNMLNSAHAKGVKVVLSVTIFSGTVIEKILTNEDKKINLINNLYSQVTARNADGIDINFEGIPSGQTANLTNFMRQLRDSLKSRNPNLILTCAPTDFDFRAGDWDLSQITQICDLTFLQCYGYGYSTGTTAGPVGRLQGWSSLNAVNFINTALSSGALPSKTVYGMPHYGYDWPTSSQNKKASTTGTGSVLYYPDAKANALEYSRLWDTESLNAWYRYQTTTGSWRQAWYEDPESAFYKYQFIKSKNLVGVGMWALGMDNTNKDIWRVLEEFVKDTSLVFPPEAPILSTIRGRNAISSSELTLNWMNQYAQQLKGFRVYLSKDSLSFPPTPYLDENYLKKDSLSVAITNLDSNSIYYVKVHAVDTLGNVSPSSDVYAASTGSKKRYLVVDGFDRTSGSYSLAYHNFTQFYSEGVFKSGRDVDACSNEALIANLISLSDYSGVIWFLGDESTANKTLNPSEQLLVQSYLQAGGNLLITGSEIAFELRTTAPTFLTNYLKANYESDNSGSLLIYSTGNIFRAFPSDIQLGITYPEDWPDGITPTGGSIACLNYRNGKVGGVYYKGIYTGGMKEAKLIFLSFALETTNNTTAKNILINDALNFFEGTTNVFFSGEKYFEFSVSQNYPNPFNSRTKIEFFSPEKGFAKIQIFNILGELVISEEKEVINPGRDSFEINASKLSSGSYFYRVSLGSYIITKKFILIK
ncbi:MAG: T9SS type A sorting domain-containing protein [Ignavibacteria bacterium]|nr:T9SS type A sorting domain-containing protein [Ignavibacteria bacterium]